MATDPIASEAAAAAVPQRRGLSRFAKAAGGIVTTLIVLDLIAGALSVWFGAGLLKP